MSKMTAAEIKLQLLSHKPAQKFRGSGYAYILTNYFDGQEFTVTQIQAALIAAGILKKNPDGSYNDYASDCITRMQRTSSASGAIQKSYSNWLGCVQREGKNDDGESLYSLTKRGMTLGKKLYLASQHGISVRGKHVAKRIDKQLRAPMPTTKRGFRAEKSLDVLARTKAIKSRSKPLAAKKASDSTKKAV